MNWTKAIRLLLIMISIVNFSIIIMANAIEPNSMAVLLSSIILFILTAPILFFVLLNKGKVLASNAAIIAIFLIIMEGLFFFRIVQHPSIPSWRIVSKNFASVEFLDQQPFVKFKPNVIVRSDGFRGSDFTYEWLTDEFGFKNPKHENIGRTHFDFIALGDSFTEAAGVQVNDTWISKIANKSNYIIYNAGVQGYSASQMKATYEGLQSKIEHNGIIIGLLPTIFEREATFVDEASRNQSTYGAGGIKHIAGGISIRNNSFLTGFLRAISKKLKPTEVKNFDVPDYLSAYAYEIPFEYPTTEKLISDQNWKLYIQNIIELSNMAIKNGKMVILIQFPPRHIIYFNTKQLNISNFSETRYYVELELLRNALPKEVLILDMFPYIKEKSNDKNEYIFFQKDAHMNEIGQDLIAEFLILNFQSNKSHAKIEL
jgi:hypothetical protein